MVTPLKLKRQQVKAKSRSFVEIAEENPVAKVLVKTPVSFLEDIYDYLIPAELSESIVPGVFKTVIPCFADNPLLGLT